MAHAFLILKITTDKCLYLNITKICLGSKNIFTDSDEIFPGIYFLIVTEINIYYKDDQIKAFF